MLAHAFASLGKRVPPAGLKSVHIFGADVGNPRTHWSEPQLRLPKVPSWVQLSMLQLDNNNNFISQLYDGCQCKAEHKFDAVVMRQGLCFCEDVSWYAHPPHELNLLCKMGSSMISGIYKLERELYYERRPAYRHGSFLLFWRPWAADWAIVSRNGFGEVFAFVEANVGSPALARDKWQVWDGCRFQADPGTYFDVVGTPAWKQAPSACKCCGGISLCAAAIGSFMDRVVSVLNEAQPKAFALLHGGLCAGTAQEVSEIHAELGKAVHAFNARASKSHLQGKCAFLATLLEKQRQGVETVPFWERLDGILLMRMMGS